jgi:hypothetical protein
MILEDNVLIRLRRSKLEINSFLIIMKNTCVFAKGKRGSGRQRGGK